MTNASTMAKLDYGAVASRCFGAARNAVCVEEAARVIQYIEVALKAAHQRGLDESLSPLASERKDSHEQD